METDIAGIGGLLCVPVSRRVGVFEHAGKGTARPSHTCRECSTRLRYRGPDDQRDGSCARCPCSLCVHTAPDRTRPPPTRGEVELHQPVVRPISCHVTPGIPPVMQWQTKYIFEAFRIQQTWLSLACALSSLTNSRLSSWRGPRELHNQQLTISRCRRVRYRQHLLPHCHSYKQMRALRSMLAPSHVHKESDCWLLKFCVLHI